MVNYILYDKNGLIPPGTPFPRIKSIFEYWHIEREKGYYNAMGEKVEKGTKGIYEIYGQNTFAGVKPHPQIGNLEFYKLPQDRLQEIFPINEGAVIKLNSEGGGKFFRFDLPDMKRLSETQMQNLFSYIMSYYLAIFGSLTSYEQEGYEFLAKKGKQDSPHVKFVKEYLRKGGKKGHIRVVPWSDLFTARSVFSDGRHAFAVLHAYSVLCGVIKFGEILRDAPNPGGNPVCCHNLTLWIGIPEMDKFSAEALLDTGVKLMAWWGDPTFRSGSILKSRLFLLFRVGMEFSAPIKLTRKHFRGSKVRTKRVRQFLVTLEAPTAGCFEFTLLKKGFWLYKDMVKEVFSKWTPHSLKFSIQALSAYQHRPSEPVITGQYSNLAIVKVPLRKSTPPDIEIKTVEW